MDPISSCFSNPKSVARARRPELVDPSLWTRAWEPLLVLGFSNPKSVARARGPELIRVLYELVDLRPGALASTYVLESQSGAYSSPFLM